VSIRFKKGDLVKQSHPRITTDAPIHYGIVVVANASLGRRGAREVQVHWPSVPYWSEHLWIRMIEGELVKVEK
jgi:hypothetical protein